MSCYNAPPTETVYVLLATADGAVIATAGGVPILMNTYVATCGTAIASSAAGRATGPSAAGESTGPSATGESTGPKAAGSAVGPKESC